MGWNAASDQGVGVRAVLVAMEAGALWPKWLARQLRTVPNLFCAVERGDDGEEYLGRRVDTLGKRLDASPYSVELAVLLCGPVDPAMATRIRTALTLGSRLTPGGSSELVLVSARRSEIQDSLLCVAEVVAQSLRNPAITVRTLFSSTTRMPPLARAGPRT
jgi:hypothetical protein